MSDRQGESSATRGESATPDNWQELDDGGIICDIHGVDRARSHCVACEIEFELRTARD